MSKSSDIKINEILAHNLYMLNPSDRDEEHAWRKDHELREKYRKQAEAFTSRLELQGVHVGSRATKKLDEALEAIITVPAVKAYDLEAEAGDAIRPDREADYVE